MAKSKFLSYQDANGDGLIDVCGVQAIVPEEEKCPTCVPNPSAPLTNWRKKTADEAFFNERACLYHALIVTRERDLLPTSDSPLDEDAAAAHVRTLFEEHQEKAIEAILLKFNKSTDAQVIEDLKEVVEYFSYDLDPRPLSQLKLLYAIAHEHVVELEEATAAEDASDDVEEEEEESLFDDPLSRVLGDGPVKTRPPVTYMAANLRRQVITVIKGLHLYSMYYKVYRAIDSGNLVFKSSGKVFDLDRYGAMFLWGDSVIADLYNSLDSWLNDRDHNLFDSIRDLFKSNVVEKIEITYTEKYKVHQVKVWTQGCPEDPSVYKGKKVQLLNEMSGFKNPTAVGFFAKLQEMETGLTAREPQPWLEFMIEHTYPEVDETFNFPIDASGGGIQLPEGSCIASALAAEGKQLGQDLLDEAFGLGDAVAYAFHKNLCLKTPKEAHEQRTKIGIATDPNTGLPKNVFKLAQEQAYKRLQQDDADFLSICTKLNLGELPPGASSLEDIWELSFNRMKLCGLKNLMGDALECLLRGMTLEEALGGIIMSALTSMNMTNFGALFKGLPPEEQTKLDELVRKKLESGDIFTDTGVNQQISDTLAGPSKFSKPWEVAQIVEGEQERGETARTPPTEPDYTKDPSSERERRTLVRQLDVATTADQELSDNVVIQAYAKALIDVYDDRLIELLNRLNKLPGAQLVANILAVIDCPMPPLFEPSVMDFIKDIELPICRDMNEITLPKFANPFGWYPNWADWPKIFFESARQVIQQAVLEVLTKILVKICEIIGEAACEALGLLGDLAQGKLEGGKTLRDILRESICGEDVDDQTIDDTFGDLLATLGTGAEALANSSQVSNFVTDISTATTRKELLGLFMGNNEGEALNIIDSIIDYGYPLFREGLSDKNDIAAFFKNVGNLMPLAARANVQDVLDSLPADDAMPAVPSLCATIETVEEFNNLRSDLLDDRATPAQIANMNAAARAQKRLDLDDLQNMLQRGIPQTIMSNIPSIVSTPGSTSPGGPVPPNEGGVPPVCQTSKSLIPYEPEEAVNVTVRGLTHAIEQLKVDYSLDMIGAGGGFWPSDRKWGLINMILCDTQGKPYTEHLKWANRKHDYVDFVIDPGGADVPESVESNLQPWFASGSNAVKNEHGQYPLKVAPWLQETLRAAPTSGFTRFSSGNTVLEKKTSYKEIDTKDVELTTMPDLGYNVTTRVLWDLQSIENVRNARKGDPDLSLIFRDANKGNTPPEETEEEAAASAASSATMYNSYAEEAEEASPDADLENPTEQGAFAAAFEGGSQYSYGLGVSLYLSDIVDINQNLVGGTPDYLNRFDDNARVVVTDVFNPVAAGSPHPVLGSPELLEATAKPLSQRKYEFLSVDDRTFEEIDLENYPAFLGAFQQKQEYLPQVLLLKNMIENKNENTQISASVVKENYDGLMATMTNHMAVEISNNEVAFTYGAVIDALVPQDGEYVVAEGQTDSSAGTPYGDATINGGDSLTNDDQILGISRDQFENERDGTPENTRIFYLDPGKHGGSYINPPYYIKPLERKGWMGVVDVLFPELSPCKPSKTELIDFGDIDEYIRNTYDQIPEDSRLKSDPDCVLEAPYNRILDRAARAGIESIILTAIRIYASTHFIKSFATFTTFKPDFSTNYSSIYSQYVVEFMEESFKSGDGSDWGIFEDRFRDDEFWYAFLEQAVQLYSRKVDTGAIDEPPSSVLKALLRLNDVQENYRYPNKPELKDAKEIGDEPWYSTLRSYREEKNFEAIQATDEDAKLVLKELVTEQLQFVSDKFMTNIKALDIEPKYNDIELYLLTTWTNGGIPPTNPSTQNSGGLDLDKEIKEDVSNFGEIGAEDLYTHGGELMVVEAEEGDEYQPGDEYVGWYHITSDEDDNPRFMAGEMHHDEAHAVLTPVASKIQVPIGDIEPIGSIIPRPTSQIAGFIIEKYIKINDRKETPDNAISEIRSTADAYIADHPENPSPNLSDLYPGTLELVTDESGRVVGLSGELGVRYGIELSIEMNGIKYLLVESEVDALDLPVNEFAPFEGNSKLLLCLINQLRDSDEYKLLVRYIFPLNKLTAVWAIYNDMAFLSSIGEVVVANEGASFDEKPGMKYSYTDDPYAGSKAGWAKESERAASGFRSFFIVEWDEWDKVLLRNSKSRIKNIFKTYYYSRTFKPGDPLVAEPGKHLTMNMLSQFKWRPGFNLFPWWKRKLSRTNPFDKDGNLC